MKVLDKREVSAECWNSLVQASAQAWVFHTAEWSDLEAESSVAENLSFALFCGTRPAAIMPLYHSKIGLGAFVENLVHNGLHRHTGLALSPELTREEIKAARTIAMQQVMKLARERDADRIYIGHQNLAPESRSQTRAEIPFWVSEYGFHLGNSFGPAGLAPAPGFATTVVDQIVDLDKSEEELFSGLKEAARRAVRKARKSGFAVADATTAGEDCVPEYYELARKSAKRTGESLPPERFYRAIRDLLGRKELCTFLFIRAGQRAVAAAILLHYKEALSFFSGVSDPEFLEHRVNELLHWEAIRFGVQRECRWYRLGPYFPAVPKGWPIETVSRFKTKFGGDSWTIVQGSLFLKPARYRELALQHLKLLCEPPSIGHEMVATG